MKEIKINGIVYELEKNYKDAFEISIVTEKYTDYFKVFDYVFGDFSYDKLRLKGFYDDRNKNAKKINKISGLDNYIKNYCSYECRYFLLKKKKVA